MQFEIVDPSKKGMFVPLHTSHMEMAEAMTLFRESYLTFIIPPKELASLKELEGRPIIFSIGNKPHVALSVRAVLESIKIESKGGGWSQITIILGDLPTDIQKSVDQISDLLGEIIEG